MAKLLYVLARDVMSKVGDRNPIKHGHMQQQQSWKTGGPWLARYMDVYQAPILLQLWPYRYTYSIVDRLCTLLAAACIEHAAELHGSVYKNFLF